jgi:hypothetical protein
MQFIDELFIDISSQLPIQYKNNERKRYYKAKTKGKAVFEGCFIPS